LKRRRVVRALVGYGIAAFAVLQIIEPIMHALHWPDAVLSYVVAGLAIGFPIVVSLAWIFDVNAGRIERTVDTTSTLKGVRLGAVLIAIGLVAAAPGTIWYFAVRGIRSGSSAPAEPPSIAVLPFADVSPGKDQDYFSDGLAEEILNALARIEGLKVAGRTSSFSFKGKAEDLRDIGQKLGVAAVLEGSVRRAGDRIRVTAQVINVADGFHVWSETYDRNLSDVFAVQDEVARSVAAALKIKLLSKAEKRAVNPEAYALFLLGNDLKRKRPDPRPVIEAYEKSVAIDPTFARAWARLSIMRGGLQYAEEKDPDALAALRRGTVEAAERAMELGPELPDSYLARGALRASSWDWAGAQSDFDRAIELAPSSAEAHISRADLLEKLGRLDEALAGLRKATELEPLSRGVWMGRAQGLVFVGQYADARAAVARARELARDPAYGAVQTAWIYYLEGNVQGAAPWVEKMGNEMERLLSRVFADHLLGRDEDARRGLESFIAKAGGSWSQEIVAQGFDWIGDPDRTFEWLEKAYSAHDARLEYVKAGPAYRKLHGDPRWAALLKKMNLPLD
jgi:TolB-like protein/Flp pilus assembly protein TadD